MYVCVVLYERWPSMCGDVVEGGFHGEDARVKNMPDIGGVHQGSVSA